MEKIRLLIADDHPTFLEGLSRLLQDEEDLECIATTADGKEAIELTKEYKPDIAVIDVSMPRVNGIEATRQIRKSCPDTRVLMVSAFDYHSYILSSLQAGAAGYMLKDTPLPELVSSIRLVYRGKSVLDQRAANIIVGDVGTSEDIIPKGLETLPLREVEILKLTAKGMSNKEISDKLFISERTVQTHLIRIYRKLRVNSRTKAVTHALSAGWLTIDDLNGQS